MGETDQLPDRPTTIRPRSPHPGAGAKGARPGAIAPGWNRLRDGEPLSADAVQSTYTQLSQALQHMGEALRQRLETTSAT